jgi:hypothetical protein
MNDHQRTPKTLVKAVENGIGDALTDTSINAAYSIAFHVRDYLAQIFTVAIMLAQSDEETLRVKRLWEKITHDLDEQEIIHELKDVA